MSTIEDLLALDEGDRAINKQAYTSLKDIAIVMNNSAPDCKDKRLAFRALHLALMHFGAALSRHPKYHD